MKYPLQIPPLKSLTNTERTNLRNFAKATGMTVREALKTRYLLNLAGVEMPTITGHREPVEAPRRGRRERDSNGRFRS